MKVWQKMDLGTAVVHGSNCSSALQTVDKLQKQYVVVKVSDYCSTRRRRGGCRREPRCCCCRLRRHSASFALRSCCLATSGLSGSFLAAQSVDCRLATWRAFSMPPRATLDRAGVHRRAAREVRWFRPTVLLRRSRSSPPSRTGGLYNRELTPLTRTCCIGLRDDFGIARP